MSNVAAWETLEHHHRDKSSDWYWSVGIIAVSLAILAILFNNILFAIFILVAAFAASLHAGRIPHVVEVEITKKGVRYAHIFHPYSQLDSFWVEEHEHMQPAVILKSKKFFVPLIVIPIDTELDPDDIRDTLLHHLPEERHHETIFHRIFEYFGF